LPIATIAALFTGALPVSASDVSLSAVVGVGGRYRPDTWTPVTVTAKNTGSQNLRGQVQVFSQPTGSNNGPAQQGSLTRPSAVYAAPLTLPPDGAAHFVTVYIRNMDAVRDNLTVQYVDGLERGGGQVFDQISAVSAARTNAVKGASVNGTDLMLIGVADDPSAFNFLRGQHWDLIHTRSGARAAKSMPSDNNIGIVNGNGTARAAATVEVTSAPPVGLPDRTAGYSGADSVFLRADSSLDQLTEAQLAALKDWVAEGGHLVIFNGSGIGAVAASSLSEVMPAGIQPGGRVIDVPGAGRVPAATLAAKAGARTILTGSDGMPLAVAGRYGGGFVTVVAVDATSGPFHALKSPNDEKFWSPIVTVSVSAPESLIAYIAQNEEGAVQGYNSPSRLSNAVLRIASFHAPDTATVALFLFIYIMVLVPINYLVLKRMDRKEWAWLTIPVLVLVFAGGTYATGFMARGGGQFINRLTVLESAAGSRRAGSYDVLGLFSSRRASYDLTLADSGSLAAIPAVPRYNYYGGDDDVNTYSAAQFVQTGGGIQIQDAAVDMWAMRTFDFQSARDLGGSIDANLKTDPQTHTCTGTIVNHTNHALQHCIVAYGGTMNNIGDLPAGASTPVSFSISQKSEERQTAGNSPAQFGGADSMTTSLDDRMRAGALDFLDSIAQTQPDYGGGYNGLNDEPYSAFGRSADAALFLGWGNDDSLYGPVVKVDGQQPSENRAALIAVHIPLPQ